MNFVLPLRPSRSSTVPKTPKAARTTKTLQPPLESPRRRPSLATRAGVTKRRSSVATAFNAPSMSFFEAMFGDDFPDTFPHGDGRSCKSKKTLFDLPAEILEVVCQTLSQMDIKRLRLTSRELAETVALRINRVFISPNRANLDCLNNILNYDRYRLQVQEIVWDDAQLDDYPTFERFRERIESDQEKAKIALEDHLSSLFQGRNDNSVNYESIGVEKCIDANGILTDLGKAILLSSGDKKSKDILVDHAASMSVEDSYTLYQKLYQDEKQIIKRAWDVAGLQRALTHLPNLKRITITTEVWRPWRQVPTYDTPFYRALPTGFRKPSVWPWISCSHLDSLDSLEDDMSTTRLPAKWRGYSIVMALLATNPIPNLQEFILDTGQENIGLPHVFFALSNVDYTNTIQVLSTAPLRTFQFSFIQHAAALHGQDLSGRVLADIDLLKYVISAMPHLEHLDLKWNVLPQQARNPFSDGFIQQHCPRLKNLALRYAKLAGSWLYNLIVDLKSLETVVLDRINLVVHETGTGLVCEEFFSRLREYYNSRSLRGPTFTWIERLPGDPTTDRAIHTYKQWAVVDEELDFFLYDGGVSPWIRARYSGQLETLRDTFGWVMDGRDPSFRKSRTDVLSSITRQRNPWPIDGAMSDVHPDWRIY